MTTLVLILVGIVVGLALVVGAGWVSVAFERRSQSRRRSWLAAPSGDLDDPPAVCPEMGYHGAGDGAHH